MKMLNKDQSISNKNSNKEESVEELLAKLAKRGKFPNLSTFDQDEMPEMVAAVEPVVNLTSKSGRVKKKLKVKEERKFL